MTQYYTGESYDVKKKMYLKAIADTKPGVRYLIIHCGYQQRRVAGDHLPAPKSATTTAASSPIPS